MSLIRLQSEQIERIDFFQMSPSIGAYAVYNQEMFQMIWSIV